MKSRLMMCAVAVALGAMTAGAQTVTSLPGAGTSASPYIITTADELAFLAARVNTGDNLYTGANSATYYRLESDIDLSADYGETFNDGKGWIPIGNNTSGRQFLGNFDGNGHIIRGLYINDTTLSYVGLFGNITNNGAIVGSVKNLRLEGVNIRARGYAGGLIGRANGSSTSSVELENISVDGMVSGSQDAIGGIVGESAYANISNSYSISVISGRNRIGGLIGAYNYPADRGMENSYSMGAVRGVSQVGGLIGVGDGIVANCYSTAAVSGTDNIGGLFGSTNGSRTRIENSAALNPVVTGTSSVGRIIGNATGYTLSNNIAFSDMLNLSGTSVWPQKGPATPNGEDISSDLVLMLATLGGRFSGEPWATEAGKLPGLGRPQDMPDYIKGDAGTGTSADPYIITEVYQLLRLAVKVNTGDTSSSGKHYLLSNDIYLTGVAEWTPIGNSAYPFRGVFDGGYNFIIGRGWLFGYVSGGSVRKLVRIGGGVAASVSGTSISDCITVGTISGSENIGGIVGEALSGSSITDCYSMADIIGTGTTNYAGGLVGYLSGSTITNCYSTGAVSGTSGLGGLVGAAATSTVTSSYWDIETSGRLASAAGTGRTPEQMKTQSTYVGWDFGTTWAIDPDINDGYPALLKRATVAVASRDRIVPPAVPPAEAAVIAPVSQLAAEFTVGPNPVARGAGKVSFFRQGKRVDNATLTVYDASGNVVSKVRVSDKALGTQDRRQVAEWNLKDSKGRLVPEGAYLVRGVVKTGDGKRERWSVVVGVR